MGKTYNKNYVTKSFSTKERYQINNSSKRRVRKDMMSDADILKEATENEMYQLIFKATFNPFWILSMISFICIMIISPKCILFSCLGMFFCFLSNCYGSSMGYVIGRRRK